MSYHERGRFMEEAWVLHNKLPVAYGGERIQPQLRGGGGWREGKRGVSTRLDDLMMGNGGKGGGLTMMGAWGYGNMMGWAGPGLASGGILMLLTWLVLLIDLILLGLWLWKQLQKNSFAIP